MPASNSVLLDRKYFKELLRRADCSAANNSGAERAFEHAVLVPSDEYEALQLVTRRFVTLCDNLRSGGVEEDALRTLWGGDDESHVDPPLQAPTTPKHTSARSQATYEKQRAGTSQNGPSQRRNSQNGGYQNGGYQGGGSQNGGYQNGGYQNGDRDTSSTRSTVTTNPGDLLSDDGRDEGPAGTYDFEDSNTVDQNGSPPSPTGAAAASPRATGPERQSLRTIQLSNLPESATLADVAAAVRGGPLLELYIRAHDRSAFVSFVRGPDAKEYFDHVRKHDLYIKTKRVDIRWSERQFTLMTHVGAQINAGATRNMVIYQCDPRITEEHIRKDLEHIHNLVLMSIKFASGNCYIKANSVHNAMFARSCLMSRVAYKGSRIEWDADECAEPLPRIAPTPRPKKKKPTAKKTPGFSAPNRFQLLKLGDGEEAKTAQTPAEDDSNEDEGGATAEMP